MELQIFNISESPKANFDLLACRHAIKQENKIKDFQALVGIPSSQITAEVPF